MIYPLIIPLFYIIRIHVNLKFSSNLLEPIPFFLTFLMHCGLLLGGISGELISLILKYLGQKGEISRSSSSIINQNKPLITFLQRKERKGSFKIYIIIAMIVILDSVTVTMQSILSFYSNGEELSIFMKALQLYVTAYLSLYVLNIQLYKHQKLSFFIILIGALTVLIAIIYYEHNDTLSLLIILISSLISNCFGLAFYNVWQKYIMETEFFSVSKEMMIEGLIGAGVNIVFLLLTTLPCSSIGGWCKFISIVPNIFDIFTWISKDSMRCFTCFGSVVLSAILNFCFISTNKLYNPSHRPVCDVLCFVVLQFYYLMTNKEVDSLYSLKLVGSLFLIIGIFIYNEYVILYMCGLEQNTKKEITLRSQSEYRTSIQIAVLEMIPDFLEQ